MTAPPLSLLTFQQAFSRRLLEDGAPGGPGFEVHRSNVRVSLRQALKATFPVVRQLVGDAFFEGFAAAFVAAHPPKKGWLSAYGGEFPMFVAQRCVEPDLGYLADIAHIEWARVRAANAPYDMGLDLRALAALPAPVLERQRLRLPSAVSLIASDFPVFDIWAAHQGDNVGAQLENVALSTGRQHVLVCRPDPLTTTVALLSRGDAALLSALDEGTALAAAHAAAIEAENDYDLSQALLRLYDLKALSRMC